MGSKDNRSGLANRPLRGCLRLGLAMYLDRYICLNSLNRDSQDSCHGQLGLVREGKSPDNKYVPWIMNKEESIIHQQLSAHRHPCSRVSWVSAVQPRSRLA
jgi:hypothetical protein